MLGGEYLPLFQEQGRVGHSGDQQRGRPVQRAGGELSGGRGQLLDFVGQALVISANDPSLYRSFIHGIRYPQQGILRDNEKRVYFRVLRELVDGCKQEGSVHAGRDREELVADLVALHRGMLLEWRIYEGAFDLPRRGRRMAAALLEGWRHEEE